MQLRRILLLFALVLGLSALAASIAPPPPTDENDKPAERADRAAPSPRTASELRAVRFSSPPGRRAGRTVRVRPGTRLSVHVEVRRTADVELEGLGLRQTATGQVPARFELLAPAGGDSAVLLHRLRGGTKVVGRLRFDRVRPARRSAG